MLSITGEVSQRRIFYITFMLIPTSYCTKVNNTTSTNCALILMPVAIIRYFWFVRNLYYISTMDYSYKIVWCIKKTAATVNSLQTLDVLQQ